MKVTHGAVMAECFDPDYRMLNADLLMDQEPGVGQVSVVVLQTKDYMALTAQRDELLDALSRYQRDEAVRQEAETRLMADRDQLRSLLRDVLHERLDGEGLPCWLRDDIRHALEKGAEL